MARPDLLPFFILRTSTISHIAQAVANLGHTPKKAMHKEVVICTDILILHGVYSPKDCPRRTRCRGTALEGRKLKRT